MSIEACAYDDYYLHVVCVCVGMCVCAWVHASVCVCCLCPCGCVCACVTELMFLETSALTGENVEEAFVQCARKILNKIESGMKSNPIKP